MLRLKRLVTNLNSLIFSTKIKIFPSRYNHFTLQNTDCFVPRNGRGQLNTTHLPSYSLPYHDKSSDETKTTLHTVGATKGPIRPNYSATLSDLPSANGQSQTVWRWKAGDGYWYIA